MNKIEIEQHFLAFFTEIKFQSAVGTQQKLTTTELNYKFIMSKYCIYHTLGLVICNWAVLLSMLITIWCTFDAAGRSWVKMKKYQRSMRESESRFNYKRSGSMNRNWRQRSVAISIVYIPHITLNTNTTKCFDLI